MRLYSVNLLLKIIKLNECKKKINYSNQLEIKKIKDELSKVFQIDKDLEEKLKLLE
jgi:hypothetical protein